MMSVLSFLHGNLWGIGIGLVLGWFFLKRPEFMTKLLAKIGLVPRF